MAATEGQQLKALISKRLRAYRKKYNQIIGMEESISQGKTLDKDQKEILRSKPIVIAIIEELEKIRLPPPPPSTVSKEISLAAQNNKQPKARKEMARDEEGVTAKKDIEDCKNSDGVNADDEVSKDDTSSASLCSKKSRRRRKSKRQVSNIDCVANEHVS